MDFDFVSRNKFDDDLRASFRLLTKRPTSVAIQTMRQSERQSNWERLTVVPCVKNPIAFGVEIAEPNAGDDSVFSVQCRLCVNR